MWIKICGNTNLEDACFAAESGADAVGFVFAPSPRQVEADVVREITARLPRELEKYGVFVDAGFDEIVSTVTTCGLTGVQLHRSSDPLLPSRLSAHFANTQFGILRVLHYGPEFANQLKQLGEAEDVDRVLVDTRTANAVGGTGTTFNWLGAQRSFERAAPHLRLIVAGGLDPENVKQAIQTLRPWGVDVVSGVESAPGKKDPSRVRDFIQAAKDIAAEFDRTNDLVLPGANESG